MRRGTPSRPSRSLLRSLLRNRPRSPQWSPRRSSGRGASGCRTHAHGPHQVHPRRRTNAFGGRLGCSLLGDGCGTAWAAPRASEPRLDACRSDSNAKGRCCVPARAPRASSIDKERMPTRRRPLPKRDREPSVRRRTTSDGEVSSVGDSKTIGAARSMEPPRRRASRAPHPLVLAP